MPKKEFVGLRIKNLTLKPEHARMLDFIAKKTGHKYTEAVRYCIIQTHLNLRLEEFK